MRTVARSVRPTREWFCSLPVHAAYVTDATSAGGVISNMLATRSGYCARYSSIASCHAARTLIHTNRLPA